MTAMVESEQKCHTIVITGEVQDTEFRSIVADIGRAFGMSGFVFTGKDGSVKIVCCCEDYALDAFMQIIRMRAMNSDIEIEDIKEKLLPFNIGLPDYFGNVSSDDEIDI